MRGALGPGELSKLELYSIAIQFGEMGKGDIKDIEPRNQAAKKICHSNSIRNMVGSIERHILV